MVNKENYILEKILSSFDYRDYIFQSNTKEIPPKYQLPSREIENQGFLNSCVSHSLVSALETYKQVRNENYNLSRMYHYFFIRYIENKKGNVGVYLRDACKVIKKYGIADEDIWSYNTKLIDVYPPKKVIKNAKAEHRANIVYQKILINKDVIYNIKSSLIQNQSVIFAMRLNKNFYDIKGKELKDTLYIPKGSFIGNHAMHIIGWDDDYKAFIVENSWGSKWGYKGLFLLPYNVFKRKVFDIWNITLWNEDEIIVKKNTMVVKIILFFEYIKGFIKRKLV